MDNEHNPFYSIRHWNAATGHPHLEIFSQDGDPLEKQILDLNSELQQLNTEKGLYYPKLNIDLRLSRSKKPQNRQIGSVLKMVSIRT